MKKPFISKELLNNYYSKELFIIEIKFKREFEKTIFFKFCIKIINTLNYLINLKK